MKWDQIMQKSLGYIKESVLYPEADRKQLDGFKKDVRESYLYFEQKLHWFQFLEIDFQRVRPETGKWVRRLLQKLM